MYMACVCVCISEGQRSTLGYLSPSRFTLCLETQSLVESEFGVLARLADQQLQGSLSLSAGALTSFKANKTRSRECQSYFVVQKRKSVTDCYKQKWRNGRKPQANQKHQGHCKQGLHFGVYR